MRIWNGNAFCARAHIKTQIEVVQWSENRKYEQIKKAHKQNPLGALRDNIRIRKKR